ncbi:MAG TPA: GDSL-type esterase/lipase family protein [Aliidongia sp.]|uniref:GDSL-type esterase/lipase family protein n=1 Tax=Aliidongia sp. TaxID=1914230 RepID=UPI002DDD8B7C|nr:GDSL-type esterase/lipase family protein [Aliidongia sp.]HEV2675040.1 GDSL-type esterase/lipase family protein [Aliidongia sp.]
MDRRLCFFGDSFVNGTADPDGLGWVGRICAEERRRGAELTCYNLGIRRNTSADLRARWSGEAVARLPDMVDGRLVFSFGVNDCTLENGRPRLPLPLTLEHAEAVLTAAAGWKPTLFIGPPPIAEPSVNGRVEALSGALSTLCVRLGIPYLDSFTPLLRSDIWMSEVASGDGAHPGAAGYVEFARTVSAWSGWRDWFQNDGTLRDVGSAPIESGAEPL